MVRAPDVTPELQRLWTEIGRRCPRTVSPGVLAASRAAALLAVPAMILVVVSPLLLHPWTLGQHNWDQMNTQRQVVVKTILRFGQFPFWDPYTCGGHAAWGSLESAPIVVSPWLPVYLLAPLPIAIRIEIIGSAIVHALGCWKLGGRFTQSTVLRVLLAVAATVNSRWGQQLAVGHTWHLLYGLVPWVLFLFDRAIDPTADARRARRDVVGAACCLALMVYGDAIYPVPQTAFLLVVYALVVARARRSWRPVAALAILGAVAVGLAAPKLLPLAEELQRFPRHIRSEEAIWPWGLVRALTWRVGDFTATTSFTHGMWHEWGLYLGWPGLILLVAGIVRSRGDRERALKWAGFVMLAFVLGGFHPAAPWRLLHLLPVFKSQHVPARWMNVVIVVLACAAIAGAEQWLRRRGDRRAVFEALLGFAALGIAIDMGLVARMPIAMSFVNPVPSLEDHETPFHVLRRLPPRADYRPCLWDVATLPAVIENVGTMECDTDNGIHITHRDADGRMPGVGAWGDTDPDYRGEAYVAERPRQVRIASWTPNEVSVAVEGAQPGEHLVLNQNWDPGWTADGATALALHDAVATSLSATSQTVVFRYRPRLFSWGIALLGLTALGLGVWLRPRRAEVRT